MTMRNVGDLPINHRNSSAGITFETSVLSGLTELVHTNSVSAFRRLLVRNSGQERNGRCHVHRLRKMPQRE